MFRSALRISDDFFFTEGEYSPACLAGKEKTKQGKNYMTCLKNDLNTLNKKHNCINFNQARQFFQDSDALQVVSTAVLVLEDETL